VCEDVYCRSNNVLSRVGTLVASSMRKKSGTSVGDLSPKTLYISMPVTQLCDPVSECSSSCHSFASGSIGSSAL
jgi:hypothetical protein